MGTAVATIVFTDLTASTEMTSRLGDERANELRRQHFSRLRSVVADHAGREVKSLGDGLMLVFQSPSQAVTCAVAMQRAVAGKRNAGERLRMRVGISVGETTLEEGDYFGTPVIEAARLVAAAGPEQIYVTELVRALAANRTDLIFESVGSLNLKGLPQPVPTSEVRWTPAPGSAFPLPPRLQAHERVPLVGRSQEMEALAGAWQRAQAGARYTVVIGGELGIGKSSLTAELAFSASEDEALVLLGSCDEELTVPYQPFVESLGHLMKALPDDELADALAARGGDLTRLFPELARRFPDLPPPQLADPDTERYLLFRAVTDTLSAISRRHPVLLVLEDLQWADAASLLMLKYLLTAPEPMSLLAIGTYRDSDVDRSNPLSLLLADLRRVPRVERLSLRGLTDEETAELIAQLAGERVATGVDRLAATIHRETDGSPFFVRELLRHLSESGVLTQGGNGSASPKLVRLSIPDSIREVIVRRLSRLPETVERTLSRASVVGNHFDLAVVTRLTGLPRSDVIEALEQATSAALIREVADVPGRFKFAHPLIRDTLYEQLGVARRIELHRVVAEALEAVASGRDDAFVDELAHHWLTAMAGGAVETTDAAKVAEYAERAGWRAMDSLAYEVAVQHFDGAARAAAPLGDTARHCDLLIALGEAQRCAGDPCHRETLLEAGRMAVARQDATRAARAALANQRGLFSRIGGIDDERVASLEAALGLVAAEERVLRGRLLALLASELHWGDWERRVELGRQALATVRGEGDLACLVEVLVAVWFATWGTASVDERAAMANELAALAPTVADRTLQFYAAMALFLSASERADMERADEALATCERLAEELRQPVLLWRAANVRLNRAWSAGRWREMEDLTAESMRLGEAAGQPDALPHAIGPRVWLRILEGRFKEAVDLVEPLTRDFPRATTYRAELAWAYAELGRAEEARALLTSLRGTSFSQLPRDYLRLVNLSILARTACRIGWTEIAAELYELLAPSARSMIVGQTAWLGPIDHDLGLLLATLGRVKEATEHFRWAVDLLDRIGARVPGLNSRLEWARVAVGQRDERTACALLSVARSEASELGLHELELTIDKLEARNR